jgi:Ca-activated chloride channel family protein
MLRHWFAQPLVLYLLALPPALGMLYFWNIWRKRLAFARLGNPASLQALVEAPRGWWFWRGLCLTLGLLALVLGTAGPQWGRDYTQSAAPGRDLVVVLDCSRSMFAETPSRLQRAKTALLDLSETIKQHGGHRLALVVFAGRAKLVCPLTHDYDHFRDAVEAVDADAPDPELEPGPGAVSGTRIGAALHQAMLAHDPRPEFHGARDILLLSDGDDPAHDGEWREGADEAREQGVPIYTVGLGEPDAVSVIRVGGEVLKHDGQEVRTRLEETPLRDIAETTHGVYFSARTRTLALGQVYLNAIAGQARREETDDALPMYGQQYPWFLATSFLLMALAVLIGDRRRGAVPAGGATAAPAFIAYARTP